MKNVLLTIVTFLFCFNIPIYSQEGTLDQTFGNNGFFKINSPDGFYGSCNEIVVDPSNNIFSIGKSYMEVNDNYEQIVVKLLQDGNPDATFGVNGIVILPSNFGTLNKIDVQDDGKIVISSNLDNTLNIIRLNLDGSFDSSFSNDGVFTISGNTWTFSRSILLYDNQIFIGGKVSNNSVIFKLDQNGILDSTFGTNGFFYLSSASRDIALQVDNQGMLYCAYSEPAGNDTLVLLTKINTQGELDITFGSNGSIGLYEIYGGGYGELKIINNSLYLFVGWSGEAGGFKGLFAKTNLNGTPDASFGNNGIYGHSYRSYSFLVQNDNKILSGGFQQWDDGPGLFRLDAYGEFDNSFGNNGMIEGILTSFYDFKFQGSENFLIGGATSNITNISYAISRYSILNPDLSINQNSLEDFKIYPNPIETVFKIYSDRIIEQIKIYDISGKHIRNYNKTDSYNISNFKSGLYLLKVKFVDGSIVFKKIVKK
ncbi:T9SS type A sorting domain-containing protein [Patiriisocius sp. Uisw_017]|jgi:uncharacterized delta-60 repeat protein|uniref:T9SS type A sorting domain-containing protein n=1 Tax=Patiriisocius sp. Uisw_017 TaxID=3230968 RepID=UPI0039E8F160